MAEDKICGLCGAAGTHDCYVEKQIAQSCEEHRLRRAKALQFWDVPTESKMSVYVSDDKGLSAPYILSPDGSVTIEGNDLRICKVDGEWFIRCPDGGVAPLRKDKWLKPIASDVVDWEYVSNPFLAAWLEDNPDKAGARFIKD